MKDRITIDNILLAKYDNTYYVSQNGDIYSNRTKKFLKHYIDHDGYHRVDIHKKHIKVHKMVWLAWNGSTNDLQINHIDDNKNNNHISNLYLGTQKQNIHDCFMNNHRIGNMHHLTIYDKVNKTTITFYPASKFIEYCGHTSKNGSVKKFFDKKWFKENYNIIDYGKGKV